MASGNSWAYDIESTIYSIVKAKTYSAIKKKYPNLLFTNKGQSDSSPTFPTVYIHMLAPTEQGRTIDGQSINGLLVTFQVDVSTNTSSSDVRWVTSEIAEVFKAMRFEAKPMPETSYADKIYRSTARFRRVIGANDRLL